MFKPEMTLINIEDVITTSATTAAPVAPVEPTTKENMGEWDI